MKIFVSYLFSIFILSSCSKGEIFVVFNNQFIDSAPTSLSLTVSGAIENIEKVVTLNYSDIDNDQASNCSITNLSHIIETYSCSCTGGVCTVGFTGTTNYFGEASFSYSVTANDKTSKNTNISFIIEPDNIECPTGFIPVRRNATLGINDFCVMKYEARCVEGHPCDNANDAPISQPTDTPWNNIRASESAGAGSGAQARCESMSEVGFNSGTFTLISNPEWMTIARSIEKTNSNWSGGNVGNGSVPKGWVIGGFSTMDMAPAITAGENCLYTVTDTTFYACANLNEAIDYHGSTEEAFKHKRAHKLYSTGEIWDFSGNISEWVDWDPETSGFNQGPTDGDNLGLKELDNLVGSLTANDVSPLGPYNSVHLMGKYYPTLVGGSGYAFRGENYMSGIGNSAGIYSLMLYGNSTTQSGTIGFRCVWRP
ncbi:MAG: hypothetical protein HON90_14095 [Halobacteriovoraceae bacterium]|nr:hypothetical protein [Halobacteriovoraceae bacterium]